MRGSRRQFLGWIGAAIATAAIAPVARAPEDRHAGERHTVYGLAVYVFGDGATIEFSGFANPAANGRFSVLEHRDDGGLVLERIKSVAVARA